MLFIVVIGDHCFPCGVTFLRMHQETYNYYVFTHRILSYLVFLYFTIKPLWHLWTSELRLCRPRSKFWGDLTRLFLRESLTPCLSLSLWFRTTYPQLFAGISLRVETQVRYAMLDDGAEVIVLVLPADAAECCCLLLVPCQVCYGSCRVSWSILSVNRFRIIFQSFKQV